MCFFYLCIFHSAETQCCLVNFQSVNQKDWLGWQLDEQGTLPIVFEDYLLCLLGQITCLICMSGEKGF